MNIQEQNVPQSYRDLFATIPENPTFSTNMHAVRNPLFLKEFM